MLCMWKRKNNSGFTLIELLIVAVMLAVVSFAIYATLNSGLKIWQRVNRLTLEEDVDIFFERVTSDVRNGLKYTGINFLGRADEFELPTLVISKKLQSRTIGKVKYTYDGGKKEAARSQMDFSDIYDKRETPARTLLAGVKSLKFQYYVYDNVMKEYLWQDEWATGVLPSAIKIELELTHGDKVTQFTKTTGIPAGN